MVTMVTLGRDKETVARDVHQAQVQGEVIGLKLNKKKCEFISHTAKSSNATYNEFIHRKTKESSLLGAPLNTGDAMDVALSSR